jgi:EthD domain
VIKRLQFASRAVGPGLALPVAARPVRATISVVLPELADGAPRHDAVTTLWFRDRDHVAAFEAEPALGSDDEGPVLLADEVVVRGEEWLERRWSDGGPKLKHLALAVRAPGLTAAVFSERWRNHAGQARAGADRAPTPVPDEARGRAYVQDHPRPRADGEWAYDAVSEVWFDDLDGLQRRIDWFRDNDVGRPDDLFGATWFVVAREELLDPSVG